MKTVALTGSIPGDSEKLDVTVPALTPCNYNNLEEKIGLPFLGRGRKGIRWADAGTVIFE